MPATSTDRTYRPLQRGNGLRLQRCQCRAAIGAPAVDEEHGAYSITLVERGRFTYRTSAGQVLLAPGWLMLGNAGQGYACSHEGNDGSGDDCAVLSMSAEVLDSMLHSLGATRTRPQFDRACLPPVPRVAGVLHGLLHEHGDEGFALEEAALSMLGSVRRAQRDDPAPTRARRQDERARAAAHCIETRSSEPLTLDEVARAAGLGPFQLLRIFRCSIGVTPHQYLMRTRLMRAVDLLRDTSLPITDIAYGTGWSDLSNFNRAFRRELRCSPRELRRGDRKLLESSS